MLNWYVPSSYLLVVAGGFAVFSVAASAFVGPKRYNRAKLDAYECGIEPTPQADGRRPLPGEVLPDRDAVHRLRHRDHLPVPVGRRLRPTGLGDVSVLVEMVLFIVTVFVAYAYVWRRGGLEWD